MNKVEVINYLHKNFSFSKESINKLEIYENMLLDYNQRYNLIAKSTEINLWERHILDSAQMMGLPSGADMNMIFNNMSKMLDVMKKQIDKDD